MQITSPRTRWRIGSPRLRSAAVALVAGTALAACYAPALPAGAPCQASAQCPDGQACITGACAITRGEPVDGSRGSGSDGTGGTDGAGGSGTPPGDAGVAVSCASSDTCAAAMMLGSVSGDTSSPVLTAPGYRAAWFRIRVTEDDVSLEGGPLRLLATLTLPAGGADFDVIVHLDPAQATFECTAAFGTASASGNTKQVRASWGSNGLDDPNDDSRDVAIEIRPSAATCDPGAHWQLSLAGDTN
jgi:hypothetical protein